MARIGEMREACSAGKSPPARPIRPAKNSAASRMPGVGFRTRARVLASGLLDAEYIYENLVAIPGVTEAQARTVAEAAKAEAAAVEAARTEVRVS